MRDRDFHVIPVLLPGAERPRRGEVAHLEFLINASWVEFLTTLDDEPAFRRLVWGIAGSKPSEPDATPYEGVCPYRGLEAFRPEDAPFFFGRENLTGWLVSALRREVRAPLGVRFLGVLGPSGSGKSSIVLAGMVASLRAGHIEGSDRWPVAIVRPADDPLKALTEKIIPLLRQEVRLNASVSEFKEQEELLDAMLSDREEAATALDRYVGLKFSGEPDGRRLVIVVDQFEEVFTLRPQDERARDRFEKTRRAFFANLLHAAAALGGRVAVLLTLRSDFVGDCALFEQLGAVLGAHQEMVGPMNRAELRAAIQRPAWLVGSEAEPSLTERLVADVERQPGALPMLQFALTEVWKKRDVRRMTLKAYIELGRDEKGQERGIEGVLDNRANEIYDKLTPEDRKLCRRLLVRLVQLGEGTEDTKRRMSIRELQTGEPARADAVRKLVRALASPDARLLTTDRTDANDGTVEVANEALIRGWTRLRRWIDAERVSLRTYRRLSEAAREWADALAEVKDGFLYASAQLEVYRESIEKYRSELSPIDLDFLTASEEAQRKRDQEKRGREAAERQHKQDELENERRLREIAELARESERERAIEAEARRHAELARADAETRRAEEAQSREREAEASRREAEAAAERQMRLRRWFQFTALVALLLAVASGVLGWQANVLRNKAESATSNLAARLSADLADAEVRRLADLADSERSRRLDVGMLLSIEAARTDTREARASLERSLNDRPEVARLFDVWEGPVTSVAFEPGGRIAAGFGGGVLLFNQGGERVQTTLLAATKRPVACVSFGPGGRIVAGYDHELVLLGEGGRQPRAIALRDDEGRVTSVAFGPGGRIAAGYFDDGPSEIGGVVLLGEGGERVWSEPLGLKGDEVTSVTFEPDGRIAAGYQTFGRGGGVMVFGSSGERLWERPVKVTLGSVTSLTIGPGGRIAAGCGGGVELLDDRGAQIWAAPLRADQGSVTSVAFGPGGRIAAGFGGGVVRFDEQGKRPWPALVVNEGRVTSVAFGPGGRIAAGFGGGVVRFDEQGKRPWPALVVNEGRVSSVAFGPGGRIAAGFGGDRGGGVVLFAEGGDRLRPAPLEVMGSSVTSVAFGPGGCIAAGYGVDGIGGVVLFDGGGERLWSAPLEVMGSGVTIVAFGPGGCIAAGYRGGVVIFGGGGEPLWSTSLWAKGSQVDSVAFGPGGRLAAGFGYDGVVLFDIDLTSWRQKAGQVANRNFTREEWARYFHEVPYRRTVRSLPFAHDLSEDERQRAELWEKEHPEEGGAS